MKERIITANTIAMSKVVSRKQRVSANLLRRLLNDNLGKVCSLRSQGNIMHPLKRSRSGNPTVPDLTGNVFMFRGHYCCYLFSAAQLVRADCCCVDFENKHDNLLFYWGQHASQKGDSTLGACVAPGWGVCYLSDERFDFELYEAVFGFRNLLINVRVARL